MKQIVLKPTEQAATFATGRYCSVRYTDGRKVQAAVLIQRGYIALKMVCGNHEDNPQPDCSTCKLVDEPSGWIADAERGRLYVAFPVHGDDTLKGADGFTLTGAGWSPNDAYNALLRNLRKDSAQPPSEPQGR